MRSLLILATCITAALASEAAARPSNADSAKLLVYSSWKTPRTFLGCLSCAATDPTSIWNPASPYGWANPSGVWSDHRHSVCDISNWLTPPYVFDARGTYYYKLSVKSVQSGSICDLYMSRQGCAAVRAVCEGKPAPPVTSAQWTDVSLIRF